MKVKQNRFLLASLLAFAAISSTSVFAMDEERPQQGPSGQDQAGQPFSFASFLNSAVGGINTPINAVLGRVLEGQYVLGNDSVAGRVCAAVTAAVGTALLYKIGKWCFSSSKEEEEEEAVEPVVVEEPKKEEPVVVKAPVVDNGVAGTKEGAYSRCSEAQRAVVDKAMAQAKATVNSRRQNKTGRWSKCRQISDEELNDKDAYAHQLFSRV